MLNDSNKDWQIKVKQVEQHLQSVQEERDSLQRQLRQCQNELEKVKDAPNFASERSADR
jgi:septal ring factor EnvC (AmiA/AmiB activator)